MNFLILLVTLLTSNFLYADAKALFASDGSVVKIIVQGREDLDGLSLFNTLKVDPEETETLLIKTIKVESNWQWKLIYEIKCRSSKLNPENTSCTIGLDHNYNWIWIDQEKRTVSLIPYGDIDTFSSYNHFKYSTDSDIIFKSSDNHLIISIERDRSGNIFRFRLEYKEQGKEDTDS